jgi:hypothetical protein
VTRVGFPAHVNARRPHNPLESHNALMTLRDAQQQRLLERLRQAGPQPVAFADLHGGGIEFPAVVVGELELHGYATERVYDHGRLVGVRLLQREHPDTTDTPTAPRRRRRWPHR